MRRFLVTPIALALIVHTASCGLVLYPERQGQKSGQIDPAVAILDAAGLIVFIIPGLIAFAVDFITGCIYLPGGSKAAVDPESALRTVYLTPEQLTEAGIESTVASLTGRAVDLQDPSVQAVVVADETALRSAIAGAL